MNNIYLIKNTEESTYKIGVGIDPKIRLQQLQTGNSAKLEIVNIYQTEIPFKIEKILHRRYSHLKKHGEWFYFSIKEETNFLNDCVKIEANINTLKSLGNNFI